MTQIDIITIIKENKVNELTSLIKDIGKIEVLSDFAEVLDNRAYLTIDLDGNLKRKNLNFVLPTFAYIDEEEILAKNILNYANLKERQNLDKIERFSNKELEKVKENFLKTVLNGNLEFAKRYGKELFLRDPKEFYKTVATFALIGNSEGLKPLLVLSLKKLFNEDKYNENIFYLFISYMCKFRDNTEFYEKAEVKNTKEEDIKERLLNNSSLLYSKKGFGILCALQLLKEISVTNKELVLTKLQLELEDSKNSTLLNEDEKRILELFL